MTPGQLKTFGKVAKVAAPVMAFTPVGAAVGTAVKKGGKGISSVVKSVAGKTPVGSAVGKGLSGAGKILAKTPAAKVIKGASRVSSPVSKVSPVYGSGVSKAAKAADMLKRMKIAGEVAKPTGAAIKLARGGMASVGGKLPPATQSIRKKVQKAGIKTKGVLALFLDLPFV